MGAWTHTSFGNDDALDFVHEVEASGEAAVVAAFERVNSLTGDAYLEAPEASAALAAAELVAAAGGRPPIDFPEQAAAVVGSIKNHAALKMAARKAAARILANSELLDLWSEGDDPGEWVADVEALIERLS